MAVSYTHLDVYKRQAVGHLTPFVDSDRREIMPLESFAAKISNASERVYQYREAVGNEVDLCIEIHRQLNVPEAIALGREIEQARPMFFEDPVLSLIHI